MKVTTLEAIGRVLEDARVTYLVAGGVAVNAHGHQRLTQDLDLVLRLTPDNTLRALRALATLGYKPLLPVGAEEFADPERRQEWITSRNMEVFSLVSDRHRDTTVALFVTEPFDFEEEYRTALVGELSSGVAMRFVRLETLIRMKEATGRPLDDEDVRQLRWISDGTEGRLGSGDPGWRAPRAAPPGAGADDPGATGGDGGAMGDEPPPGPARRRRPDAR